MTKDLFPREPWIDEAFDFNQSGSLEPHEEMFAANTFAKMAEADSMEQQKELLEAALRGEDVCNRCESEHQENYQRQYSTKTLNTLFYIAFFGGLLLPVLFYEAVGVNGDVPLLIDLPIRFFAGLGIWKLIKKLCSIS